MCSLDDFVEVAACLVYYPFYAVWQWTSWVEKLDNDMLILEGKCKDLSALEDEMRAELRRNDGRKRIVNNNFGIWVEGVARIKIRFDDLHSRGRNNSFSHTFCCVVGLRRNVIHQLLREANFFIQSASSLISYGSVVRESQIYVGKETKKSDEIWECLMDPKIGRIGIYGPGGVGKTTIIMNITTQLEKTDTFDKIVFVTISKNWSGARVQENIAMQLGIDLAEHGKRKELYVSGIESQLEKLVYEHLLKMERCLFIFDDMWYPSPKSVWNNMIPSPTRENGFKIVFISRFRDVCHNMGIDKEISLAPLADEDAWDLFVRDTANEVLLDPEIQAIAREIVLECEGLPINVVTISRAMRGETNATLWTQALHYLQRGMHGTGTNPILRFCYNCLKRDEMRKCFLYCGLFPEDYKFKSKELVGYWIAENYTHNSGDILASINEGNEILRELIDANMLGMCMEGGTEFFKMHDLIRDFSISIMNHESDTVAQAGLGLERFLIEGVPLQIKKVSLIGNQIDSVKHDSIRSNLSTLLLKDNPLTSVPPSFFSFTRNLQVLDISHSAIAFLPVSLCTLPKLRALFLQYCTYLDHIPSLAKLQELQYLNLSGTLIKKLPEGIERLVKLRSLDLSNTPILKYIHPGAISSLTNLEELHMQGSHICKTNSPFAVESLKEIRCLNRLSILTLSAVGYQDHLDTICYLQGHNLKCFSVNVYGTAQDYAEDV